MDATSNRYFIVFSSASGLSVPLPPPDNPYYYEMIEPGTTPINNSIANYYRDYYSTWGGYVISNSEGYFAAKGPFVSGEAVSQEALAGLGDPTATIRFVVPINRIFTITPNTIYFDVVTVSWPDGEPKIPADHLATTNAYIANNAGASVVVSDSEDQITSSSLDILGCSVEVQ